MEVLANIIQPQNHYLSPIGASRISNFVGV